jgi:hypothetical protein
VIYPKAEGPTKLATGTPEKKLDLLEEAPKQEREESKQTEPLVRRSEEDSPKENDAEKPDLNISITSITDPRNLLSSRRDPPIFDNVPPAAREEAKKVGAGTGTGTGTGAGTNLPAELRRDEPNPALNISALSDLNMSRAEEHPLIIDLGLAQDKDSELGQMPRRGQSRVDQQHPGVPQRVWQEKYMRKGSHIGINNKWEPE